jgi:predicted phosphodiesterase
MLDVNPKTANIAVVVSGHTHRALVETFDDVLYVNPGSAGPRRFSLPVSIGFLRLSRNAPVEAWLKMM